MLLPLAMRTIQWTISVARGQGRERTARGRKGGWGIGRTIPETI